MTFVLTIDDVCLRKEISVTFFWYTMEIPPNSEVPADAASSSSEKEFVPGYKTVDDFIKVRRCCTGYFFK
jgi:hypothetical protein